MKTKGNGWTKKRKPRRISSQPRYDHFDTSPCVYFNPLFLRSKINQEFFGEKSRREHKKYSFFHFEKPYKSRISGGRNCQVGTEFRTCAMITTSKPLYTGRPVFVGKRLVWNKSESISSNLLILRHATCLNIIAGGIAKIKTDMEKRRFSAQL